MPHRCSLLLTSNPLEAPQDLDNSPAAAAATGPVQSPTSPADTRKQLQMQLFRIMNLIRLSACFYHSTSGSNQGLRPGATPSSMALSSAHAGATMRTVAGKTTVQLYRDCLRVVDHIASKSPKGIALRNMVRSEFRRHSKVEDEKELTNLKMNAARALANYLLYEAGSKEPKIRARMAKTTEEMVKQCMENAKRERERRERGQSELEHLELDAKPLVKPVEI